MPSIRSNSRANVRLAMLAALVAALGGGVATAHNGPVAPDCPVLILKSANAKPHVIVSFDLSGSMYGSREVQGEAALRAVVSDPTLSVGIEWGYQEWSSNRTGSCAERMYVPLQIGQSQWQQVYNQVGPGAAYGGTPTNLALQGCLNDYRNRLIPNDTVSCRKRFIAMVTDGGWNCTGDPCPTATQCGQAGVKVIAIAAFGVPIQYVQCLATNSGGTAVSGDNQQEIIDALKRELGATLTSNVTISPSIQGTVKDPLAIEWTTVRGNVQVVCPVTLPAFEGHFKAYSLFNPDNNDPYAVLKDTNGSDFNLMWDAGAVTGSMSWQQRTNLFTQDGWATCWTDPYNPQAGGPNCGITQPSALSRVPFMPGMSINGQPAHNYLGVANPAQSQALINFIRGRQVTINGNTWNEGGEKAFKLYGTLANGGVIFGPPRALIDDSDYTVFRDLPQNKSRETLYGTQSDGGGFFAVSAQSTGGNVGGREKWHFIPKENLSRLKNLLLNGGQTVDAYTYLAQGRSVAMDIELPGLGWRTVVVFGLGAGGRSYYMLDVTEPVDGSGNPKLPDILWAFTHHDNHTGGNGNKSVLTAADFGNMGLALSTPAVNDPRITTPLDPNQFDVDRAMPTLVVGSGPANDHLLQPDACVGPALQDQNVGHFLYSITSKDGALRATTDVRSLGNSGNPDDVMHDIILGQVNGLNRIDAIPVENTPEVENLQADVLFNEYYIMGGARGNLYRWDGCPNGGITGDGKCDPQVRSNPGQLVHLTSARTSAESDTVLPGRPIVSMPLVFSPNDIDVASGAPTPCQMNGATVSSVAYFGTGNDSVPLRNPVPPQYIFGVNLTSGAFPVFDQLPGSPVALQSREYVIGEPMLVRVRDDPQNPIKLGNVVLFLTYTAAQNACGAGYSSLYTLDACSPTKGGWDTNGDGAKNASDRRIDLTQVGNDPAVGGGRATSINVAHEMLLVTAASGFVDVHGAGTSLPMEPAEPPSTETFNWKILD